MKITVALFSKIHRLLPAVFGVSKSGVRVSTPCIAPVSSVVGDDAYFVTQSAKKEFQVCGVADGVGGWHNEGIDPSLFANALMEACSKVATMGGIHMPVQILKKGLEEVTSVHSRHYGSSTACILSLDCHGGILHTANLGDSGFLVARDGVVLEKSEHTVHSFNCPFQLANPPPKFVATHFSDSPSSAKVSSIKVKEGDLIVLTTDGFFDNMYDAETVEMLKEIKDLGEGEVKTACIKLVEKAFSYSQDWTYFSPFAKEGAKQLSWDYAGGKHDDITMILVAVQHGVRDATTPSSQDSLSQLASLSSSQMEDFELSHESGADVAELEQSWDSGGDDITANEFVTVSELHQSNSRAATNPRKRLHPGDLQP